MQQKPIKEYAPVSALLNEAIAGAATAMLGAEPTDENLAELASRVRSNIVAQVYFDRWSRYGLKLVDDVDGLVVTAGLGNELIGEPPIKLAFNFTRTARPTLVVEMTNGKAVEPRTDIPRPKVRIVKEQP